MIFFSFCAPLFFFNLPLFLHSAILVNLRDVTKTLPGTFSKCADDADPSIQFIFYYLILLDFIIHSRLFFSFSVSR